MSLLTPHLPDTCTSYYELLGLRPFEADPRLIDARTKEMLREARKYQVGRYSAQAEKHLNLVAEARGCLLDPAAKSEYDARLQREWGLPPVSTVASYSPKKSLAFAAADEPLSSAGLAARARSNRRRTLAMAVCGTVIVCLVVGVGGMWIVASRSAGGTLSFTEAFRQWLHPPEGSPPSDDSPDESSLPPHAPQSSPATKSSSPPLASEGFPRGNPAREPGERGRSPGSPAPPHPRHSPSERPRKP